MKHNVSAVFKRELSGSFHRLYAYITVGLTLVVSAVLLIIGNLAYASENILSLLSNMSLVVALVLPINAVNSFSYKKDKVNTDALYDMMPLSAWSVAIGKYLAALVEALIPSIVICGLYPLIAAMFSGDSDLGVSYSSALAFPLFQAALLAVYMFISSRSKSRLRAYIYCYTVVVLWYIFGIATVIIPSAPIASLICFAVLFIALGALLWYLTRKVVFAAIVTLAAEAACVAVYLIDASRFSLLFERFFDKISVFVRFDTFTYGIFDVESLIFFVSVCLTFVFLTYRNFALRYEGGVRREGLRITRVTSMMLAICIFTAALGVNAFAAAVPDKFFSLDATKNGRASVSDEAKAFLATVDKDVTVYLLEPTGFAEDYELYLSRIVACNDRLTLKEIRYDSSPEFYSRLYERLDISADSVSANSLVIECGDNMQYLSYYDMFTYTNSTLGFDNISVSEYEYYYSLFSQSADYADYLYSLAYDTSMNFRGDYSICGYIEYVTADVIPSRYALTGHGEKGADDADSVYYGIPTLDILSADIPRDAACILVNMPSSDITEAEKQKLLDYLDRGGQLTFVTDEKVFDMPNILSVLAAYGMSADRDFVSTEGKDKDGNKQTTTTLTPALDVDNDVLYELDGAGLSFTVTDANAIIRDASAKKQLIHYPLVVFEESDEAEGEQMTAKKHILACAAETTDTGAHVVWFTGGDSYNDKQNQAYAATVYALYWVSMEYESATENIPYKLYGGAMPAVESGAATFIGALLVILPLALMTFGGITVYRRKKAK